MIYYCWLSSESPNSKLALVLARDRELAGALALSFDLVLARDLVSKLTDDDALTLDRNLDLTLTLTLALADALADTLAMIWRVRWLMPMPVMLI